MLMGDTGSGKSSAIRQILRQVQERGETAIVYDPAMDFVGEFYDPNRGDLILNPLDARCPYWSLASELLRDETAMTIAAAFLPDKEYEKAFFTDGPQNPGPSAQVQVGLQRPLEVDVRPRPDRFEGEGNAACRAYRPHRPGAAGRCHLKPEYGCRQLGVAP
jgi:hypothetical protein